MGRPCLILKADRDKSLLRRHPWIFSGAVECIDGAPASGDTVAVRDAAGKFLAWAAYNAAFADHRTRVVVERNGCHRQGILPQPHRRCTGSAPHARP